MKAICLIGTSHLAALKHGSALLRPSDDYSLDFFGCAEPSFGSMSAERGYLVPDQPAMRKCFKFISGKSDRIEIAAYDAFAIVGFRGFRRLLNTCWYMYARHTTDTKAPLNNRTLLSPAVFNATIDSRMAWEPGLSAARQLRAATKVPIFGFFKSRLIKGSENSYDHFLKQPGYRELVQESHERYGNRLRSDGLEIVDQPPSTIVDEFLTASQFCVKAQFLTSNELLPESDVTHMNADYGVLVLEQLLGKLDISPRRAAPEESPQPVARAG